LKHNRPPETAVVWVGKNKEEKKKEKEVGGDWCLSLGVDGRVNLLAKVFDGKL
jgi:hypothetical protein